LAIENRRRSRLKNSLASEEGSMSGKRTLERFRDEYDTHKLLDAVDELDRIRGILADGPNLEPPEIRGELLRLHKITSAVVNEGRPIPDDDEKNPFFLADEIESEISEIHEAAETILDALSELARYWPDEDELDDDEEDEQEEVEL
jgi:hypothetical protein